MLERGQDGREPKAMGRLNGPGDHRSLGAAMGPLGPRENLEDHAYELGCRPNEQLGQVDSIFVLTTAEGERYPVWESGPNRRRRQSPVD